MEEYQPILSVFFNAPLHQKRSKRLALLFSEGLCAGVLGLYLMHALGIAQSGSISIFLVAAVLVPRFNKLLEENKDLIWQDMSLPRRANRLTAYSILALFLGIMSAYVLTAIFLGEAALSSGFAFALESAHIGQDTILTRRFGSFENLLHFNTLVWLAIMILSFLYRTYGALLALTWNACIWGLIITFLVLREIDIGSLSHFISFGASTTLALLPHMAMEASAYIVAALAAIFFSKGIMKYARGAKESKQVFAAVFKLVLISWLLLLAAALLESHWAPWVLESLG
ncbi:MAG: stage II sporulation protein M [Myxococcota bacterium]|jgi:uncharacterized membrane protein SpoIIM required for sporulation|nr:stage II sporulation protein M [Myxococcota bacterium]